MQEHNGTENTESTESHVGENVKRQCLICWALLPLDQFDRDKKLYDRFICLRCLKNNWL